MTRRLGRQEDYIDYCPHNNFTGICLCMGCNCSTIEKCLYYDCKCCDEDKIK